MDNLLPNFLTFIVVLVWYHNCCQRRQKAHIAVSSQRYYSSHSTWHDLALLGRNDLCMPTNSAIDFTLLLSQQFDTTESWHRGNLSTWKLSTARVNKGATVSVAEDCSMLALNSLSPVVSANLLTLSLTVPAGFCLVNLKRTQGKSPLPRHTVTDFPLQTHWSTPS